MDHLNFFQIGDGLFEGFTAPQAPSHLKQIAVIFVSTRTAIFPVVVSHLAKADRVPLGPPDLAKAR
ncbi:hypothetical protein D3C75_1252750 [compost metagenome]